VVPVVFDSILLSEPLNCLWVCLYSISLIREALHESVRNIILVNIVKQNFLSFDTQNNNTAVANFFINIISCQKK